MNTPQIVFLQIASQEKLVDEMKNHQGTEDKVFKTKFQAGSIEFTCDITSEGKVIVVFVTHDGVAAHLDEIAAIGFHCKYLTLLFPTVSFDFKAIRTRDLKDYVGADATKQCNVIYDVGGVNNEKNQRDHHQDTFNLKSDKIDPKDKNPMKLSSAGLFYLYDGLDFIRLYARSILKTLTEEDILAIYIKMYHVFMRGIDADDNGIKPTEAGDALKVNYVPVTMQSRVQFKDDPSDLLASFNEIVAPTFLEVFRYHVRKWLDVRNVIVKSLDAYDVSKTGPVLVLQTEKAVLWLPIIFGLMDEHPNLVHVNENVKFVAWFETITFGPNKGKLAVKMQSLPISGSNTKLRCPIQPKEFAGRKPEEIAQLLAKPEYADPHYKRINFIHVSQFMAGIDCVEISEQEKSLSLTERFKIMAPTVFFVAGISTAVAEAEAAAEAAKSQKQDQKKTTQ